MVRFHVFIHEDLGQTFTVILDGHTEIVLPNDDNLFFATRLEICKLFDDNN